MKLLDWVHRKFRQNGNEPIKGMAIGNSCACLSGQKSIDDQLYFPTPNHGMKPFKHAQRDQHHRKSFTNLEATSIDEEEGGCAEESSATISQLFQGFLAIGTLGSDHITNDPSTPTFSISVDNITEKNTEVTENELKLINAELEKVLGAEAKDDGSHDSSGRNSHVSTGRSSHVSIITLSGKPVEGTESNGNGSTVCPLQGYLFGSAIELSETTKAAKKEHRPSLGELLQRSKLAEENGGVKSERGDNILPEKETEKSAMNLMRKVLKKRMLYASSRSNALAAGNISVHATSTETKLHKILHMFQRKVHPENSSAARNSKRSQKKENKRKIIHHDCLNSGDQIFHEEEDIMLRPKKALPKQTTGQTKNQFNPPQFMLNSIDSNGNREHWIKTDADYLVLELSSETLKRQISS